MVSSPKLACSFGYCLLQSATVVHRPKRGLVVELALLDDNSAPFIATINVARLRHLKRSLRELYLGDAYLPVRTTPSGVPRIDWPTLHQDTADSRPDPNSLP